MLSLHTSPLDPPGSGDAGGMNVYVLELSRRLAASGVEVDVFTRATSSQQPPEVQVAPGVTVRSVVAGPFEGLAKSDLPGQLCPFVREVLRVEAAYPSGRYDVVHSHYWLSGQVGTVLADRWGIPLVHAMHTMAKVKNSLLADDDEPEPYGRVVGEEQVVAVADLLVANTDQEASDLVELYDADPAAVRVIHPGVDLEVFVPGRAAARRALGLGSDDLVVTFAGRIQALKGPGVLLRAAASLLAERPGLRGRLVLPLVGGTSGPGESPDALASLAGGLGIADVVRFVPPVTQPELARWYAASTLVCVPSYNESFGLVALEAQACGTPVLAARVGGLEVAVDDGRTGVLVDGHEPADWARRLGDLLDRPEQLAVLGRRAVRHAQSFSWERTADLTRSVYGEAQMRGTGGRLVSVS
ncbi:MAG: mshA [Nocardioidaceae bacterium]|jgi:D-inositol-3-phosphate glycosyltransferase|nr:mshA [Nocardioidaceae bacterium]